MTMRVEDIANMLTAAARARLRSLPVEDVATLVGEEQTSARNRQKLADAFLRGEVTLPIKRHIWPASETAYNMLCDKLLADFDIAMDDDDESHAFYEIVDNTLCDWVDEQVAAAEGRQRPALSYTERAAFMRQMYVEELENAPQGTVVNDVMGQTLVKVAHLEALRQRSDGDGDKVS